MRKFIAFLCAAVAAIATTRAASADIQVTEHAGGRYDGSVVITGGGFIDIYETYVNRYRQLLIVGKYNTQVEGGWTYIVDVPRNDLIIDLINGSVALDGLNGIGDDLRVNADVIEINNCNVYGTSHADISLESRLLFMDNCYAGRDLRIQSAVVNSSQSILDVDTCAVGRSLIYSGSSVRDDLTFSSLWIGQTVDIKTGSGSDDVLLDRVNTDEMFVDLGSYSDGILLTGCDANVSAFHGGSGTDTLFDEGNDIYFGSNCTSIEYIK